MSWKKFSLSVMAIYCCFMLLPELAIGVDGIHYTYPMPRKVVPADPLNINLGEQIPLGQDRYQFVTASSKYVGTDEIFVYLIDSSRRRSKIGTVPPGTGVTMTAVAAVGKTIYYEIPWTGPGTAKTAWVSGYNLKATSFNPPVK